MPPNSLLELARHKLDTKDIGIVEFAEELCGKGLYPRQQVLLKLIFLEEMEGWEEDVLTEWMRGGETTLSPKIRERRDYLRNQNYGHFPEMVLVGGRRSSKGYVSAIAMSKLIYDTWKLGDPGRHYGIDIDKEIYFSCVAGSLDQAKKFQYADLTSTITRCTPLITSEFGLSRVQAMNFTVSTASDKRYLAEMKRQGILVSKDFAKIRGNALAANADTIRGSATMGIIFDEMAFMEDTEGNRSSADECYAAAEPSLAQFGKDGMIFMNSSPYTKIGIFYEKAQQSMQLASNGDPLFPDIFCLQFPSWELFRDYKRKKNPRNGQPIYDHALMVSADWDPDTLNEADAALCRREKLREASNPDKYKVERRAQWAEVQEAYLRAEAVDAAFLPEFRGRKITWQPMGSYVYQPYVAHCDPSSTTAGFGFAIAHIEEWENEKTGIQEPHVVFDLVRRWDPAAFPNGTIDYIKVCEELLRYCVLFRPKTMTFDQWNSVAPMQWLQQEIAKSRLPTRISQVTATKRVNWNRWELFKTMLYTERVHIPPDCLSDHLSDEWTYSQYAKGELKNLQVKNGSVEKQDIARINTKDIADCIAECTRALMSEILGYDTDGLIDGAFGAQGGYPIGGSHPMQDKISEMTNYMRQQRMMVPNPTRGMDYRAGRGRGRGY